MWIEKTVDFDIDIDEVWDDSTIETDRFIARRHQDIIDRCIDVLGERGIESIIVDYAKGRIEIERLDDIMAKIKNDKLL